MIFTDLNDFKIDLNNKILSFVCSNPHNPHYIMSIINSYLNELKHLGEIDKYNAVVYENELYHIDIKKGTTDVSFKLNIKNEIRKRKLSNIVIFVLN